MRRSNPSRHRRDAGATSKRVGVALLIVLIALAIVSAIGMTLLRMSLLHHQQARKETFVAQSRWLAESAFDQAGRRLKADAQSEGFSWSVPAKELDGHHAANVVVEIRPVNESPQRREVSVLAEFPMNSTQRSHTRFVRQIDL